MSAAILSPATLVARPTYRLTRRGRLVVLVAALLAVLALGVWMSTGSVATDESGTPTPTQSVVVGPGDTLWDIAADAAPAGVEVREVMEQIQHLNALEGGSLEAGQTLRVPLDIG